MKDILKAIKNVLLTNWPALAAIVILAVILKIQFGFSVILGLIILLVLYFALGCLIEYIMQSYIHYKKVRSGKSEEQLKHEAEVRERRRARGMEMLNEEQKKKSETSDSDEEPIRFVRRRSSSNTESAPREVKPHVPAQSKERIASNIRRKRTPFDIAPPAEDVITDDAVIEENFPAEQEDVSDEPTPAEKINDDVFVHTEELDELFSEELNHVEEVMSDPEEYTDSAEENDTVVEYEDASEAENANSSTVEAENQDLYEPVSVDEMQQTSADISKAIQSRVNTHRRRSHIIFDPYDEAKSAVDEVEELSADALPETEFGDDFDSSVTDSVHINQDQLDELYSEKSEEVESKPKAGFLSRAIAGFKKKRRERNRK